MKFTITVICRERNYRGTFTVEAETEGKAKTRAIMKAFRDGLHVSGEFVEYEIN